MQTVGAHDEVEAAGAARSKVTSTPPPSWLSEVMVSSKRNSASSRAAS
jgi:hypothetical protein